MRLSPPVRNILVAKHPRFVVESIGDRCAQLCGAGSFGMVIPIIALAAFDPGAKIVEIIEALPTGLGIRVVYPVAPIGYRHVIVDPDKIEIGIGPQRIKMEKHIAAAILRVVAKVFGPICRVGQLGVRAKDRPHLRQQIPQRLDSDKAVVLPLICVNPRISDPIQNRATPPAALHNAA